MLCVQIDILDDLLKRGARPLDYSRDGMTAMHCAAMYGKLHTMKRLLDEVQDKLLPTRSGRTLVHVAAAFGQVGGRGQMLCLGRLGYSCTAHYSGTRSLPYGSV